MRKIIPAMLIIVLMIGLMGCQSDSSASKNKEKNSLSLAFSTWIGYAPLYIAEKKGIFKKNGINVHLMRMESGGDRQSALASNRVQGVASTVDQQIVTDTSVPVSQILALDESSGGDGIVSKKSITSMSDLKGKTVAVQTDGGASLFWFLYVLKQNNMTLEDVKTQSMDSGDAGSAFVAKKVDAAVTWEPWLTNAKKTSFGHVLKSSESTPGVIADTLALRQDFIKQNPVTVKKLTKSWFEALDFLKNHHDEAVKIMANAMGQKPNETEDAMKGVNFYDKAANQKYLGTADKQGKIYDLEKTGVKFWKERKLIKKTPDLNTLTSTKYIN